MNLAVLRKTRKPAVPGDFFLMKPPDDRHLFGRVISTSAKLGPMTGCVLIYIYRCRSERNEVPADVSPKELLVPPLLTNRRPWTMGYFEPCGHADLGDEDVLPQHCFYDPFRRRYLDDDNHILLGPVAPVGEWGLQSFRTIDDAVSRALGIPLAAD